MNFYCLLCAILPNFKTYHKHNTEKYLCYFYVEKMSDHLWKNENENSSLDYVPNDLYILE